ncbi:heparan-alpha-glucosaminide N-acetyltransferase domain-containing protein [Microbacterium fluvii]|uniref:Heparan-alpha-glucosaminide N-acetyltransferase domain-containing protein n=1 Tax=Microbacterium fluvii TaxID=415215 RepID=A0ABW2HG15_9MICO|nr:heparan-alpha-glucosaminide N-acetyltransferase domain-containing protein [Microbacterium fluvii]MCU4673538.1 heparan-alpha-glucosaminide N-acetyltransferase domain-containing protein [Microbacterium fluvii]
MAAAAGLTAHLRRLNAPPRFAGVDLARGLAVMGMLAAHLSALPDLVWADPSTWGGIAAGRSSILFATLAGVSIALVTGGTTPLRGSARARACGRLAVRAALLWVLGVVLISTGVPVYVILPAYAVLFVLALPFTGLSARVLLPLAAVWAIVSPFLLVLIDSWEFWATPAAEQVVQGLGWHYPFVTWITFVLAGMGAARAGLQRSRVQWWLLGGGAALAALGYGWDAVAGLPEGAIPVRWWVGVWTAQAHSGGILEVVGSGGFALAVLGACLLLCRSIRAAAEPHRPAAVAISWLTLPLRAVGAMPLTAYTGQLVVWAIASAVLLGSSGDLSGFRALDPFWWFALITLAGCTAWALLVGRGPLEQLTMRVTRWVVPDA